MSNVLLICANALRLPLLDNSVQCVVTSPPYFGLREYAGEQEIVWPAALTADVTANCEHEWVCSVVTRVTGGGKRPPDSKWKNGPQYDQPKASDSCLKCGAWRGVYGGEPTVKMYVQHTIEILREIRRVLRPDGVVFWNIGDSYAAGGNTRGKGLLKSKDLCLIPQHVVIAAQVDGWWVRSDIIWFKDNPMPESVTDRPTDTYENILMLTKSAQYFWDDEEVKEECITPSRRRERPNGESTVSSKIRGFGSVCGTRERRNLRNVWTFPTQPYRGSHVATFPEELPRRCILVATSAKGACRFCGIPWERVTSHVVLGRKRPNGIGTDERPKDQLAGWVDSQTIGWRPGCECRGQNGKTVPCVVLDPFGGSGTTGKVALELQRRVILTDIAYKGVYEQQAVKRTAQEPLSFF